MENGMNLPQCLPVNADAWRDVQYDWLITVQELFITDQFSIVNEDHDGTTDGWFGQRRLVNSWTNVTCQCRRRYADINDNQNTY